MANMEGGRPKENPANLQSLSRAYAAEKLNVSERTVNTAKAVQRTGSPELIAAVDAGEVAVSAAANNREMMIRKSEFSKKVAYKVAYKIKTQKRLS